MASPLPASDSRAAPEGVSTYESNDAITATRTKLHGAAKDFCLYLHGQTFGFGVMKRRQGVPVHSCRFELAPWARELRMDKANVRRVMARLIECDIVRFTPDPEQPGAGTISWNLDFDSWGLYDRRGQKPAVIVISGEKPEEITTPVCSEITTAASSDAWNSQASPERQEKIQTGDTDRQTTTRASAPATVLSVPSFLDRQTPGQQAEQLAVLEALRQTPGYQANDRRDAQLLYQLHGQEYPPDWLLHEARRFALSASARPSASQFFSWCEGGAKRGYLRRFQDQQRLSVQDSQTNDPERNAGGYANERSQTQTRPIPITAAKSAGPRHKYAQSSRDELAAFYARQGLR